MKSHEIRTSAAFEVVKTKPLQLPLDIMDVKISGRSNLTPDAFENSTSSLYALRFFSSPATNEPLKSRLSKSRSKQPSDVIKESEEPHLSPIELTINKKIKYPHDKRRLGRENPQRVELTSSDREIIEELRHQLRTEPPRNGTTSVLEAIGDPQVREQRLFYEPLRKFLQGKERNKNPADSNLRVVNIMIPSLEKEINSTTGLIVPLALSRHNAAVSRNANRFRGGGTVTLLPKVVGNSVSAQGIHDPSSNFLRAYKPDEPLTNRDLPSMTKRKTQFILPRIGLKKNDNELEETRPRKLKSSDTSNNETLNRSKTSTVHLPDTSHDDFSRSLNGFPRRATTTATGKAHLIGPMNKMDAIADYSKALQSGLIGYNEYIKKLSVLSLHKVPMGNSIQRHFHLIRDGSNNMKPKLAHVDINSKTATYVSSTSSENSEKVKVQRPAIPREKGKTLQAFYGSSTKTKSSMETLDYSTNTSLKPNQSHLHRVDIGEGLALFDKPSPGPETSDELIVPDLARYTHFHHPRQGRLTQYHWNHESPYVGSSLDTWSNKHWQSSITPKIPNKIQSTLKSSENANKDKEEMTNQTKVVLSMEEYLKRHSSDSSRMNLGQNRQKNEFLGVARLEGALEIEAEEDVALAEEDFNYIGRIPDPPSDKEPMGLGAKEILRSVNLKLPSKSLPKEDPNQENVSEIDSVFQDHIDNMLKTIKKAKANQKQKVPELRGLVPTVIPQVLVENVLQQEKDDWDKNEQVEGSEAHHELLEVNKKLPKNTPPPSAKKSSLSTNFLEAESLMVGPNSTSDSESMNLMVTVAPPSQTKLQIESQPKSLEATMQSSNPKVLDTHHPDTLEIPTVPTDEAAIPFSGNSEIRVMTSSVDLIVPTSDDESSEGVTTDRSRLEVVITSIPVAPPASLATTTDESLDGNRIEDS